MNSVTIVLINILQPAPMWLGYVHIVQLIYMKFEDACITCNFLFIFIFQVTLSVVVRLHGDIVREDGGLARVDAVIDCRYISF